VKKSAAISDCSTGTVIILDSQETVPVEQSEMEQSEMAAVFLLLEHGSKAHHCPDGASTI